MMIASEKCEMGLNGWIYTWDRSSIWAELGQRTVVCLIIHLRINMGKQMNYPSRQTITVVQINYMCHDSSSAQMICLFAHIYTQTNYHMNYHSLPKFFPDRWSMSSTNSANVTVQHDLGSIAVTMRPQHLPLLIEITSDRVKSGNLLLFQVPKLSTFSELVISSSWLTGNRGLVDVSVYDPIPAALSASSGV